jgi:hypothetical protein
MSCAPNNGFAVDRAERAFVNRFHLSTIFVFWLVIVNGGGPLKTSLAFAASHKKRDI